MNTTRNEKWLKDRCYTPSGPYLRPFSPNEQWMNARVFIVGLNPATPLRDEFKSFDHYWESLTRNPKLYEEVYRRKYQLKETERSRTSKRISELIYQLNSVNVLVSNVFAFPSTAPHLIPKHFVKEPIGARIITKLIEACKPRVLFFHGSVARTYANRYFKVDLNPYLPPERQKTLGSINGSRARCWLYSYHHLVGRVDTKEIMTKRIIEFTKEIKLRLEQD